MRTLDRQKLDVVNKTRSDSFGWHGHIHALAISSQHDIETVRKLIDA